MVAKRQLLRELATIQSLLERSAQRLETPEVLTWIRVAYDCVMKADTIVYNSDKKEF